MSRPPEAGVPNGRAGSRAIELTVAAAFFMETLDATIITTALPAIAAGFGTTPLGVSLGVTAYLVAMAVFVPAAGWCGERFGARRVFAIAVGFFTFASLLCGLAPSLWTFVAARVLQGSAAAFMSPVGRLVVLRETPKHRLIEALSTIIWPGLIAPVLGPLLGGLIVTHTSWRWIFLLNVPIGLIGLWLVLHYIPRRPSVTRTRFDGIGFVLNAVALASLVEGLTRLGGNDGSPVVPLVMVGIGVLTGIAAIRHARRAEAPMLDLRALGVRTFAIASASAGFVSRIAINASPFLLPLMFQIGFGMSALQAGVMVLVYMAGNLLMKSGTTRVLRRFGFRKVLLVNGVLCTATLFACGLLRPGVPLPAIYALLLLAGMARSMTFTSITSLSFADVIDEHRAGASALSTILQQIALTMGVTLATFMLGASKALRDSASLELADFQHAWFAVALLMALATIGMSRLERDAGHAISMRQERG